MDWDGAFTLAAESSQLSCAGSLTRTTGNPLCDPFQLTVDVPEGYWDSHPDGGVWVSISWPDPTDDFDLFVRRPGQLVLSFSAGAGPDFERLFLPKASGTYLVEARPTRVTDSAYSGNAVLVNEGAGGTPSGESAGPCTAAAAASMPDGDGHDHTEISQHAFACRIRQVSFNSLADELAAEPEVVLGEMDVESDLAAVTVTWPESGVLFFDVADPAHPRFLSWYRGSECEADNNCGAFVDLSADGKVAFLSVQSSTVLPGEVDPATRPASEPGVEVIDVSDPRRPRLAQAYPVLSLGGSHTSRSHVIPAGPGSGEYLFSVANGLGVEITRVTRPLDGPVLTPVTRISINDVHDTFIQNDPLSGRTYLYVTAGFASGFYVYDVTDPARPTLLAEWDLTPDCLNDWYAHTIDVAIRDGRRYVTLDAETFGIGLNRNRPERCGTVVGGGDRPSPLWIVDATDLSKLGPANAHEDSDVSLLGPLTWGQGHEALRTASEAALVTTWTNPAGRATGTSLRFSAHNQQIVGDRIYLSHYHGGVYVLDASKAFRGKDARPRELGVFVPHGAETRPASPTFRDVVSSDRPTIWDMVPYKGYILAVDMFGGFYSLQFQGDR